MPNPRQVAFLALKDIYQNHAFTDIALDRILKTSKLPDRDRRLVTELVYGTVRRQRTLDAIIDRLGKKKSHQQPPDFRIILHIGLYQLRYANRIPPSAAVNTTVELAKENGFKGLAGVANGLLRQYSRLFQVTGEGENGEEEGEKEGNFLAPSSPSIHPLKLPTKPIPRLGIIHSFPDWIIKLWIEEIGIEETEKLCQWFNQSPTIDLRINPLRVSIEEVESAIKSAGIEVQRIPPLPQALRLHGGVGAIQQLPGFTEGWWTIQDSSAQLVTHLLDPQPGEIIIDACAAPGGKTTHIAELMRDTGKIWACDRTTGTNRDRAAGTECHRTTGTNREVGTSIPSRLKKITQNAQRLQLQSIFLYGGDSRNIPEFINSADRVLLDAPCSGLGTLHRRPDIRWRNHPQTVQELSILQKELLNHTATWVKPGGILVYATCTIHHQENEEVIQSFLMNNPDWQIEISRDNILFEDFDTSQGWLKLWPQRHLMDGFFMVKLKRGNGE